MARSADFTLERTDSKVRRFIVNAAYSEIGRGNWG
jgi:hypothetical protein